MSTDLTASASTTIAAPPEKVWQALTDPEIVKQYFFGTQVTTDWKVGSPITYSGEWEGNSYEEKGKILEIDQGKKIVTSYWSSMSGVPDVPENYQTVSYELAPKGHMTEVTITQEGSKDQEAKKHSEENWGMVLDGMKKLLEK